MKKTKNSIGRKITSVALIFALTVTSVCGGIRVQREAKAVESKGKYVKDIVISYASSKEKAEKELGSDYTVLDKNFNDGMSGDSWIGYSTTDDADEAIKDIKAMPMDGKYSTSDYEVLLKNQRNTIDVQLQAVIPVIIEFAKNYDAGLKTAQLVYELLNVYYEDDSKKNMGDFLLEKGRALAKSMNDSKSIKDLEKIYMEGNNYVVSTIETLLVKAQDPKLKEGSWITRMGMIGPNGLYEIYKEAYGGSKSSINKKMDQDFGETAATILEGMSVVREKLKEGEESEIAKADGDKAAIEKIASDLSGDDIEEVSYDAATEELVENSYKEAENGAEASGSVSDLAAYSISKLLKETPYGKDKTLYDLFMDKNLSKKDLYPMVYSLSSGQENILETMGVYPLFESALGEYSEKEGEKPEDINLEGVQFSVYEGVDRSVFDGDTAITDETLKNMETRQFKEYISPVELDGTTYSILAVCGVIMAAIATGAAIRSFTYETKFIGGESYTYYEQTVLKTMKENLVKMKTYENAWKLKYMEQKKLITQSLDSVVKRPGAQFEINKLYQEAMTDMQTSYKTSYKKLSLKIHQFGESQKAQFIAKYEKQISEQAYKVTHPQEATKVKLPRAGWGTRIACSIGAVAAIAFAGYEIYCMINHDKINFAHIPANMVCRTYEGDVAYLAYQATVTKNGKCADIHNKKGKGWQVLYTTADDRMGDPILASSLLVDTRGAIPDQETVPVTYFDESYAADLADEDYTGSSTERTCLFFKRGTEEINEITEDEVWEPATEDEGWEPASGPAAASEGGADTTGSVFSGSTMIWIILLIVVVVVGGAGTGLYLRMRRKKK